jgi:hypothetical protein
MEKPLGEERLHSTHPEAAFAMFVADGSYCRQGDALAWRVFGSG